MHLNLRVVLIYEVQTEIYIKLGSVHLQNVTQDQSIQERKFKNEKYTIVYQNGVTDNLTSIVYNLLE